MRLLSSWIISLSALASAHCKLCTAYRSRTANECLRTDTFPSLVVNGAVTPAWTYIRQTNNFNTQAPVYLFRLTLNSWLTTPHSGYRRQKR